MRKLAMLAALLAACAEKPDNAPSDGAMPAKIAGTRAAQAPRIPADAPTVAFLGDSIAAGLHLAKDEAFPAVLQRRLAKKGLPFKLVNAGVSGSTTAAGLARVDWILGQKPDIVVIELGANDGFRGIKLASIEANLERIIKRVRDAGAKALLLGIRLPPNYGEQYQSGFDALYGKVAQATGAAFVPAFMEGVGGNPDLNLKDGIHPTPEGHVKLADNVEQALAALLRPQ
jgi:acyl-CoA thioesterase-1